MASPSASAVASDLGSFNPASGSSMSSFVQGQYAAKEKADAPVQAQLQEDVTKDRARLDKAKDAEEPLDVKPWTEKPPEADPITAMGGVMQIFAGIAAGFSHTPAINVMNTMAAGVTAYNEKNYEKYVAAHDAWKDNLDLAIKRHQSQQADVQEAMNLLGTDISAATALMKAADSKYDDKIGMALTLSQDWERRSQLDISRQSAGIAMEDHKVKMSEIADQRRFELQLGAAKTPEQRAAAIQAIDNHYKSMHPEAIETERYHTLTAENYQFKGSPATIALHRFMLEHPDATADDVSAFVQRGDAMKGSPEKVALAKYIDEHPDATADDIKKFLQDFGMKGASGATERDIQTQADAKIAEIQKDGTTLSEADKAKIRSEIRIDTHLAANPFMHGVNAQRAAAIKAQLVQHPEWADDPAQIGRLVKETAGGYNLTPMQTKDIDDRSAKLGQALDAMQVIRDSIDRAIAVAGPLGKTFRINEAVGNIVGYLDSTDRANFDRAVAFLRLEAPDLIRAKGSRGTTKLSDPLIQKIIPGGNWLDTRQNVTEAYNQLQDIFVDDISRLNSQYRDTTGKNTGIYDKIYNTPDSAAAPGGGGGQAAAVPVTHDATKFDITTPEPAAAPTPAPAAGPVAVPPAAAMPAGAHPLPAGHEGDPDGKFYRGSDGKRYVKKGNMMVPAEAAPTVPN